MPNVTLSPSLAPEECRIATATWKAYPSPSRHRPPLGSCATGGHRLLVDAQRPTTLCRQPLWFLCFPVLLS
jgi:hypothetical protein